MKKIIAIGVLALTLLSLVPVPARAGAAVDAALALSAFAVFNQIVGWGVYRPWYGPPAYPAYYYGSPVVYSQAPVVYTAPAVSYAPPASVPPGPIASAAPVTPKIDREVVFDHGRYVLHGDGVATAYRWVWVPNPPAPPPAPPAR